MEIPLFPVNTVLLPESTLSLRVFEPRYFEMVSYCMKTDSGFGVCLIKSGKKPGVLSSFYPIGTMAKIVDWGQDKDGILEIEIRGLCRFQVELDWTEANQLIMAEVSITSESACPVPEKYLFLAEFFERLARRMKIADEQALYKLGDAVQLGYSLADFLPLSSVQKQHFLEVKDPIERLAILSKLVDCTLAGNLGS